MKKILFMIPTLGGGGAEKVLVNLLNQLSVYNLKIDLVILFNNNYYSNLLNPKINVKILFPRVFPGNIHLMKLVSPKILWKFFVKDNYDVVVSYLEGPTTRIISGSPNNTKKISWVHTGAINNEVFLNSYRNRKEFVKTYKYMDTVVFVAYSAKESFIELFPEIDSKMTVIYNTIKLDEIQEKSSEVIHDVIFEKEYFNIISVGRFIEVKGYERLIKVVAKLIGEGYKVRLYLIGEGKLKERYLNIIRKHNLEEFVKLLGYKKNPYKYMKKSDLYVASSFREGFSTAVVEAIAVGTPVATTLCSGMKEILGENGEYGLIVENNETAIYLGIKKMLTENSLLNHYKKQAHERAILLNNYSSIVEVLKLLTETEEDNYD